MTPRERLFAVLDGRPTDRMPVWLLFPYHPTGYYVDVRSHPGYREIYDYSVGKVIMLDRRNPAQVPLFEVDPDLDGKIASEEELDRVLEVPVVQNPGKIQRHLDSTIEQYRQDKSEFPADYGAMMLDLGEPINWLYHNADLQEFAIWSLTRDVEIRGFLDRIYEQVEAIYRHYLERDAADVYFMVGSELAAPPLVSRQTFQRWIVPYAKKLIALVHSYGKKVIQHFHGQIHELLDGFVEMGADAVHTIEAPPIGNCTFTQAFEAVGDSLTLIGNVQYDEFRAMNAEEMAQAVTAVLEECRGRRLILSPTAGPFDENLTETMKRNYLSFIKTAWEWN